MSSNKLNALLKTDDKSTVSLEKSIKYVNTKRKINSICQALCIESKRYSSQKSVNSIESYIKETCKIDRILYSEISNYIFSLDMIDRGVFATNVEKMLLYALDESNEVSEDCTKMIIKIYDHFQLALHQIENANNIFAGSIEEAKENLRKEIKGVEKEYISILGIFAAIVLAFVGGITFSSSVLQNIDSASIYRLLLVVDLLAFVLIQVIYMLIKFILIINDKNMIAFDIKIVRIACLVLATLILIAWLMNVQSLAEFMKGILPWCK
ncbi:hypothetical protein [Lachnotalea glycerini]|uniref:Uncharacterized protein n=1 Tax=Lachnotalea glycerini TaxID=1763509 RepID=A0A371JBM3_9FIRM|nr:hypothetical protein [Lachnotalea glycerini]RDY30159.1 hypothetical protein CG710_016095 [Lachnotalea glycerini]